MTKTITYSILLLTIATISLSTTLSNQQAFADTIALTGTVRDFSSLHPDFEGVISGVVTGLVNSNLAGDKNPDYVGIGGGSAAAGAITSTTTFDQWYVDVGGVNLAAPLTITLDNTITADPNVFTFVDSSFFPIDGQLFGNEGNSHNYHFTYEIHSEFTYNGGETFSFTGDDDLWVFINDKLAVDIGGVHGAASGSVDLDAAAASLGLTIGDTFDFDLFFAERHLTQSNFRIDTSIELVSPADTQKVCESDAERICKEVGTRDADGDGQIEVGELITFDMTITLKNPSMKDWVDTIVKDRFGAELELVDCSTSQGGDADISTKGKSKKVFLEWDVGTVPAGGTASLTCTLQTDLNPADKQEYTSPGEYDFNSGANVKFNAGEGGPQVSFETPSIEVTVTEAD